MALSQSALSELLEAFRAGKGVDLIRDSVRLVMQELIEAEATERIGAARYESAAERVTDRNGSRPRLVATQAGCIELRIPKLQGPGRRPQRPGTGAVALRGAVLAPLPRAGTDHRGELGIDQRLVHRLGRSADRSSAPVERSASNTSSKAAWSKAIVLRVLSVSSVASTH